MRSRTKIAKTILLSITLSGFLWCWASDAHSQAKEDRLQARGLYLTEEDLRGIWVNQKLDRALKQSRSIAGVVQSRLQDSWTVALEFAKDISKVGVNINNHEGFSERVQLRNGELFCHGEDSTDSKVTRGKFVLSSIERTRCMIFKAAPNLYGGIEELLEGIVFCKVESPPVRDIESYFRGLLAGRYIVEATRQHVALRHDGKVEGLVGFDRYNISIDFFSLQCEEDTGSFTRSNGKKLSFHWRWKGKQLTLSAISCDDPEEEIEGACPPCGWHAGRELYVLIPDGER
jgi:hypothetical protein